MELTWRTRTQVLPAPLRTAFGAISERPIVEVALDDGVGGTGRGEAAPLEPYDGVPLASVLGALDAYTAVLRVLPAGTPHAAVLDACAAERVLPQALAAIDLALWDLAGLQSGRPVSHLLAAGAPSWIAVNALVEDAAAAARAAQSGFGCVKVKVGLDDDVERVGAVRAAVGRDVAVRVDANGGWQTPSAALRRLEALAPFGLELCEEPVHGADAIRAVTEASPVPIALDETAAEPGAVTGGVANAVCLKIARCGGITGVMAEARAARAAGMSVYVSSTWDGPLGIAAGLHAAAGIAATGDVLACGLATDTAVGGRMAVPQAPGLAD